MSTQRNPINPTKLIDLGGALETIEPQFGRFANSGLFTEDGITTKSHIYKDKYSDVTKMTGLTSYTERDAVALEREEDKYITMAGVTHKITGGVTSEDLEGQLEGVFEIQAPEVQDEILKELTRMANTASANYEWMIVGATKGVVTDPRTGVEKINAFTNTGKVRPTATITAGATDDIRASLVALMNQLSELNGDNGNVNEVEIVLDQGGFNAIVNHPDFVAQYQMAYQGRGAEALGIPQLNGTTGLLQKNQYGWSQTFRFENLVFTTYPQKFRKWNGERVGVTESMKGWTIPKGLSDLYHVKFTPKSGFSHLNKKGQKWYAYSTGVIDDQHIDMTLEQNLIPFMKRPEMSIDITVTV